MNRTDLQMIRKPARIKVMYFYQVWPNQKNCIYRFGHGFKFPLGTVILNMKRSHLKIPEIAGRNLEIDILRGLSKLAVLLLHLNIYFRYSGIFLKDVLPEQRFTLMFRSGSFV